MSQENQQEQVIQLDLIDLINAARILEAAVARNTFTVDELVQVAPVVSKVVSFAQTAQADIEAKEAARLAAEAAEAGETNNVQEGE